MSILDLNKILMYKFHYDYIKNNYGNNSRLFIDTDNLMYEIKTEDAYEDSSKDKGMFEFYKYSAEAKYYGESKKLVAGKMKDGKSGVAIKEFFGLKSKMYSFLVDDGSKYKRVKGANKMLLQQ